MKLLLRIFGIWVLLVAVVALAIDGTRSLAGSELTVTSLGQYWLQIHASSLESLRVGIEQAVHPLLWDPVLATLVQAPAWLLLGALGFGLYWLGRPRRRLEVFNN